MKNGAIFKDLIRTFRALPSRRTGFRKLLIAFSLFSSISAFPQVGVHTDFPDGSSAMEIYATDRGLLIPRVTLTTDLTNPDPVAGPATGLLVFNSGSNQPMGFYYWDGSTWVRVGGGSTSGDYWSLTGNAGTVPASNFLGTTDNQHFIVRTNNLERMRFENDGQIVVDSIAPRNSTDLFTVVGNATQTTAFSASARSTGYYSKWGRYGLVALVDSAGAAPGFGVYARNYDPAGFGLFAAGSNQSSFPLVTSHTAGITCYGTDGLHAWGRDATIGFGIFAAGSGLNPFNLSGVSAGLSAIGKYGIISKANDTIGRGIVAVGSSVAAPSTSLQSEGGAFVGYHGIYAMATHATEPQGIGVIGVGQGYSTYATLISTSIGGSFSGDYGIYGKGLVTEGVGVLGVGSSGIGYYTITGGSGGAFTGYHGALAVGTNTVMGTGIIGAGNDGSYVILPGGAGGVFTGTSTGAGGYGSSPTTGVGLLGSGNNSAVWIPSDGCGGAFNGNTGIFCRSINVTGTGIVSIGNNLASPGTYANGAGGAFTGTSAGSISWGVAGTGTGVIGVGNNITGPNVYGSGSGGAFTGTAAGVVGYGTTAASGVGVIGAGNNVAPTIPTANGCGGAFTGTVCGVYGNATATSSLRYGGYFATTNGQYAYVGGRSNNTNQKIIGTGTVSTIVKNTQGEPITLYCPEAPEVLFQDFGTGQLVNGFAHISIDPDLAININVSENHPLKVYITPEGDCKGVYVTNKSAEGFDIIELQGGQSNVPFSWQIVATRANEEYALRDGTLEISDYSLRFAPAPGPLEYAEESPETSHFIQPETHPVEMSHSGKENFKADRTELSKTMTVKEEPVSRFTDTPK